MCKHAVTGSLFTTDINTHSSVYYDSVVSIYIVKDEAVNSVLDINCKNLTLASAGRNKLKL